ncbi:MAG: amidohydrolase [Ferruginibacter sp.]
MTRKITVFILIALFTGSTLTAQTGSRIKQLIYGDSLRLVEIFKDLHRNPEAAFTEVRTAGIIAKEFNALGYHVITGIGKTGVAGILQNGKGPVVMYRADMDCNAVKEITNLPYASTRTMKNEEGTEVPLMHACGHDAHISWMLGAAKAMAAIKKDWSGTLVFIAQPAEEVGLGAKAMVADSIFLNKIPVPDYLFGMHTMPIAVGLVDNAAGERMPGSDQLDVSFYGVGGHGSTPELTIDPVLMGVEAVLQYQTIISRNIPAQEAAVLSVGAFNAGINYNVIPATSSLKLNLRWFSQQTRNTLMDGIQRINEGIALANNVPREKYPTIHIRTTVQPVINDAALVAKINTAIGAAIGKENIITGSKGLMVSEDFPHLVTDPKKTVYNYLWIGIANQSLADAAILEGKKYPFFNHSGNFEVDLAAIPFGAFAGTTALLELFKK